MLDPVTLRAQILGSGYNNPDVEALLTLTMSDTLNAFPEIYRESPTYLYLPKSRVNSELQQWPIADSRDSFIKQPRNTSLLWSNFPNNPDTRNPIYRNVVTAEFRLVHEMVGFVQFENTEVLTARSEGHNTITNLFQTRFNEAMLVLLRDLNRDVYQGIQGPGSTQGPIKGLESILGFATAGVPSGSDADYLLNGIYHGKPETDTALEGTDYFIKWRPLLGTWSESGSTLTIHDGHGTGVDVGGGLNALGGTAEVSDKTFSGMTTIKDVLDRLSVEMMKKGVMYDAIFASPDTAYRYQKEYDMTLNRQIDNGSISMPELGTAITAYYRNTPIIVDKFCPDDRFYFLSRDGMEFTTLNFASVPGRDLRDSALPISVAFGPLTFNTLTVDTIGILIRPGLLCRKPWGLSCLRLE